MSSDALKITSVPVVTSDARLGEVKVVIRKLDIEYRADDESRADEQQNGSESAVEENNRRTPNSPNAPSETQIFTKAQADHNECSSDRTDSTLTTDTHEPSELISESIPVTPPSPTRVRFRSRVRITSGVRHHHHRRNLPRDAPSFSADSSLSSSPCSSISAPLRSPITDANSKPGWGTLGQRVGLLANRQAAGKGRERKRTRHNRSAEQHSNSAPHNERTPLIRSSTRHDYVGGEDEYSDSNQDEEAQLSRNIDLVFGKWPRRLLNRHWWWWQFEPIVRCSCIDSDTEN